MNHRWLQLEYLTKGVALALLTLLALRHPEAAHTGAFLTATLGGLVLGLAGAAVRAAGRGPAVRGRVAAFLLFLLLESPVRVYAGVLAGLLAGAALQVWLFDAWSPLDLGLAILAGVALGAAFWLLVRQVGHRLIRGAIVLTVAVGVAVGGVLWLDDPTQEFSRQLVGAHLLLAIPLLYLLTLAGAAEETELEIGAMCLALGVGLWLLLPDAARLAAVIAPLILYTFYVYRVFRPLRALKHNLRGMTAVSLGNPEGALRSYRRALELDPRNRLAREGLWQVHRELDPARVAEDRRLQALIDLNLCLDRARSLLLTGGAPERLAEAQRLLTLVLDLRPALQPVVLYWRAVAHTHGREFDRAEGELRTVLEGKDYPPDDPDRASILVPAWQLALMQHPELKRRVGQPLLAEPGRRLDAIAAVERQLAEVPDDAGALDLKRLLYGDLTEAEYRQRAGAGALPAGTFDHGYCLERGLALLEEAAGRDRGAEFMRIAATGLMGRGPWIYLQIAKAYQKAGDEAGARQNFEMVKTLARGIGVKELDEENQRAYFATVKHLGEAALARGDVDAAIENLTLFAEAEGSGQDTVRLLADLHAQKQDALRALYYNERALMYDGKDPVLLARKDQYYYSVFPDDLRPRLEGARKWFDVDYCLRKAKALLDVKNGGAEQWDWALHLLELARLVRPERLQARLLYAVVRLRRGETAEAAQVLEETLAQKPEVYDGDDESWLQINKLYGDLCLDVLGRPDRAITCYTEFRKSRRSGADTYFKMGRAYEQLGDRERAKKAYQNVTAYEGNSLAYDAYQAIDRLEREMAVPEGADPM